MRKPAAAGFGKRRAVQVWLIGPYRADGALHSLVSAFAAAGSPVRQPDAVRGATRRLADPERILFGSDFPALFEEDIQSLTQALADNPLLQPSALKVIRRHNALQLFPRLRRPNPAARGKRYTRSCAGTIRGTFPALLLASLITGV